MIDHTRELEKLRMDLQSAKIEADTAKSKTEIAHQLIFDMELYSVHTENKVIEIESMILNMSKEMLLHDFISKKDKSKIGLVKKTTRHTISTIEKAIHTHANRMKTPKNSFCIDSRIPKKEGF